MVLLINHSTNINGSPNNHGTNNTLHNTNNNGSLNNLGIYTINNGSPNNLGIYNSLVGYEGIYNRSNPILHSLNPPCDVDPSDLLSASSTSLDNILDTPDMRHEHISI